MPRRSQSIPSRKSRGSSAFAASAVIGVCLVAAATILSRAGGNAAAPVLAPVVAEFDTVSVPVPVDPVASGVRMRDVRLRKVSFPKHQVPADSILDVEHYAESVTVASLPAGLPMFPKNFSLNASGSNPVLDSIPSGMRAMTIRVDATAAVEGWAGSGSIVDVLLIERDRTSVVAERVKILSAERSVLPVEGQSAPSVPSTVTILVTQDQCLAINTAIPRGRIAFALRGSRDEENWSDVSFTAQQLDNTTARDGRNGEGDGINGFVSYQDDAGVRSFALSRGKWIRTEVIPQGTLIGEER